MESATADVSDINLGLYDGEVSHERINAAVARGHKSILFGEQTRLPYFPDDERLFKLPANDPLVLLFWKVLHKVPENLRIALIDAPLDEGLDRHLAGLLIRLDGAENYMQLVGEVAGMGAVARGELEDLISVQRLTEEDEWEAFKGRKQTIVARACQALEDLSDGGEVVERTNLYEDEQIQSLISDRPHRLTSDPAGVMMYLRTYKNSLDRFGAGDPDSDFLLASILVRLDLCDEYEELLERVYEIGTPAFTALHNVFDQIPERDLKRREILKQARILWSRLLARARSKAKARR